MENQKDSIIDLTEALEEKLPTTESQTIATNDTPERPLTPYTKAARKRATSSDRDA
jgi:hypothetical protein